AVVKLLDERVDLMLVVGGYNSSNTCHLAALAKSKGVSTFHIEDANCVEPSDATLRHQPVGQKHEVTEPAGWLGDAGVIGITAGASTPNNKVGETIARVCEVAGVLPELKRAVGER
ncbi:MAG: hypothetical protein ACREOE_17820, partial [Gemmatimonadales bacterium]